MIGGDGRRIIWFDFKDLHMVSLGLPAVKNIRGEIQCVLVNGDSDLLVELAVGGLPSGLVAPYISAWQAIVADVAIVD